MDEKGLGIGGEREERKEGLEDREEREKEGVDTCVKRDWETGKIEERKEGVSE